MKIYNTEEKSNITNFKKFFFLLSSRKKLKFNLVFVIISCIFLLAPLGLLRSNSSYLRNLAKSIYHSFAFLESIDLLDKRYELLSREFLTMADNFLGISYRYLKANSSKSDELRINLNFRNFEKISNIRTKAIRDGILTRTEDDKVNGYMTYKGVNYPIRMRLKGDWTDHLIGEKWSFRIQVKQNNVFIGMKEFSLQHPRTRNYINEFIIHEFLKYEKLPYLRYKFIPVSLNGNYLGIYALEEHFDKLLLENSGFREGPILRISDQDERNEWQRMAKISRIDKNYFQASPENSEILTFNSKQFQFNDNQVSQFNIAKELLDKFLRDELKTSEVFDIKNTAKYFAVIDILQALTGTTWEDMRFYFDPISARLTPIGYDNGISSIIRERRLTLDQNTLRIFNDPIFVKEYISQLDRITKDNYLEKFFKDIDNKLNRELLMINKSYPFVRVLKEEFFKNKVYIRNRLSPISPIGVDSFKFSDDNEFLSLEIFNKYKIPLNLLEVEIKNRKYRIKSTSDLPGKENFKRVKNKTFIFEIDKSDTKKDTLATQKLSLDNSLIEDINIFYKINGIDGKQSIRLQHFKQDIPQSTNDPLITRKSSLNDFDSLLIDKKNKNIEIKKDITISKPLILNPEYKLIIDGGVNINLKNEGFIFVQGPLIMKGSQSNPIIVESSNGGKGITVLNAGNLSVINYAKFYNLKPNTNSSLNITGGLTFYNSPVKINNSEFLNSKGEDALNLVRSRFNIRNTLFKNIFSDAIDADFSDGTISLSKFENIGNDAIDISGADVILNQINILFSGDKAISVGEKSNLKINNIKIANAFIGVASKDLSSTYINGMKVENVKYCLAAYQKKPEYGPGSIKLKSETSNCLNNNILETGSSIEIEGNILLPNINKAYEKLYLKNN